MKLKNNKTYLPRDISWMYFNHRILQEARKENVPLLERMSFLGIYSNNLDEFFRVRMASLSRIVECNDKEAKDEREEALSILKDINKLNAQYAKEFEQAIQEITNKLKEENIYLINDKEANEEQLDFIRSYYRENLNGMVIPVWFSTIKQLDIENDENIYLAIRMYKDGSGKKKPEYAFIELPVNTCGRFVRLPDKDGKSYSCLCLDYIKGGGFTEDAKQVTFEIRQGFPHAVDSGLSLYAWVRAYESILKGGVL